MYKYKLLHNDNINVICSKINISKYKIQDEEKQVLEV